jgi:hypothetical protein
MAGENCITRGEYYACEFNRNVRKRHLSHRKKSILALLLFEMTGWVVILSYILIYAFPSHIYLLRVITDFIIPETNWTFLYNRKEFSRDCTGMTVMKIDCIDKKLLLQCPLS